MPQVLGHHQSSVVLYFDAAYFLRRRLCSKDITSSYSNKILDDALRRNRSC